MQGLVMRSTGSWYEVRGDDRQLYRCRLRGRIKLKESKVTNPVTVGDQVEFEMEETDGVGVICEIHPRTNYIIRKSTHKTAHAHILAANLDQAILIATIAQPRTSSGFIDRFLVTAEAFEIPALLVFNKSDLLNQRQQHQQQEWIGIYQDLNYQCLEISVKEKKNLDEFNNLIKQKKSLLSGHSGVGKSSLLNTIAPGLNLKTGEISSFANKGVHTTTFAEMFELDAGTFIIDTPGIKELGLMDIEPEELSHFFPEMRDRFGACKYYNCSHTHEPGCAVIEAAKQGLIAEHRYLNYLSMLEDEDNRR